jgi:hypothetical protein
MTSYCCIPGSFVCLFVFGCFRPDSPTLARVSSFTRFPDHTQWRTTVGNTPLDEWSARHRDNYLTTHNTHNRQASMPSVGFERTILAGERPQTHVLDRAAMGTGVLGSRQLKMSVNIRGEGMLLNYDHSSEIRFDFEPICCTAPRDVTAPLPALRWTWARLGTVSCKETGLVKEATCSKSVLRPLCALLLVGLCEW